MKFPTQFKLWWKWHEGWIAAGFVAISSFALGYTCSTAGGAITHRENIRIMSQAYQSALSSKDEVIQSLAKSAAKAADAAVVAANTADTTANTAATVAETASTAANTAAVKAKQADRQKDHPK